MDQQNDERHQLRTTATSSSQKPKGRMSAYTFFVRTCREEFKRTNPEQTLRFIDFSKECSTRWRALSDEEKIKFFEMANRDKIRFEREMDSYAPAVAEAVVHSADSNKRKRKKDPNAPKRPLSAFFIFCSDERARVKEEHPEYSVAEISKHLGAQWATMSDSDKRQYYDRNHADKERYQSEMLVYNANEQKRMKTSEQQQLSAGDNAAATAVLMMQQHQRQMLTPTTTTTIQPPTSSPTGPQSPPGRSPPNRYGIRRL